MMSEDKWDKPAGPMAGNPSTGPVYVEGTRAGDVIAVTSLIADMFDKKGGALEFVVSENTYTNQTGQVVVKATSTLVVRNG